jgi:threonyl-tRNA synthetase
MSEKKINKEEEVIFKQPLFVEERLKKYLLLKEKINKETEKFISELPQEKKKINVTVDGKIFESKAFETTPLEISEKISNEVKKNSLVAEVILESSKEKKPQLWDLIRPLEENCQMKFLTFEDEQGKEVFWHSSSHILGEVLEYCFSCLLCAGPPLDEGGFYYEGFIEEKKEVPKKEEEKKETVSQKDFPKIEKLFKKFIKEKQSFERLFITKQEALDLFSYNKFKIEFITEKVGNNDKCSIYRCGNLIDICRGPHLNNSDKIDCVSIIKNSSSYFKGDSTRESLQRVYAITFPEKKYLKEWKKLQEDAKLRDHRLIGQKQDLWFWHEWAPGI